MKDQVLANVVHYALVLFFALCGGLVYLVRLAAKDRRIGWKGWLAGLATALFMGLMADATMIYLELRLPSQVRAAIIALCAFMGHELIDLIPILVRQKLRRAGILGREGKP